MREKISACVISFNEENKIERCLKSLTWCDEIVLMDSFSTDRTLEIARKYTDRIFRQEWLGYVGQRNMVREKAIHPWILYVDADEEVSPALRDEILIEFDRGNDPYVGYEFPRIVYFLGKWIRHGEWYPDVKLRLFKAEFGRTEGIEPHDKVVVNGPVKRLKAPVFHYTYGEIGDQLHTLNRFSSISAQQRFVQDRKIHVIDLILHPFFRFLKGYILKGGILDGMHGFIIAMVCSFASFAKYAKHWELLQRHRKNFKEFPDQSP